MVEDRDGSGRVLVVDDQEAVARTVARWLVKGGFDCDVANSMEEALGLIDDRGYGIVFADVNMPGGSGLELARAIKEQDTTVQVVIITGNTRLETAVEALRLDADDYLLKPFASTALLHAARRAADHRQLLLENRDYRENLETRVREQAERLESLYLSSIHSLVSALEAKDPHTSGHSERVAEYALALLDRIGGIDPDALITGARLHDIGKIGVTSGLLRKKGSLTGEETREMREHPAIGEQILAPLLHDADALAVVRHHHERWDGAGYPDGLAGKEIPMAARIVAVADAFDAMTTSRPYRAALSAEHAASELEGEAGAQFDPDVVRHVRPALLGPHQRVS